MKEEYITPRIEVVEFDTEDVITTSNTCSNSSDEPIETLRAVSSENSACPSLPHRPVSLPSPASTAM